MMEIRELPDGYPVGNEWPQGRRHQLDDIRSKCWRVLYLSFASAELMERDNLHLLWLCLRDKWASWNFFY
jgi:hypothetical protein